MVFSLIQYYYLTYISLPLFLWQVMLLIGEAFVAVDEDEATAYVEKKQKVRIHICYII